MLDPKDNGQISTPTMLKKTASDHVNVLNFTAQSEKEEDKSDLIATPPLPPTPPLSATTSISAPPSLPKEENFIDRHSRWLRGVQILDELTDCGDSAEAIFCYVIMAMLKEINEQYQSHPEWTDVLMEEKRCLSDSLKAMGR